MNAIGPIEAEAALPRAPFDAARDAANAWRGRCLDLFARSEAAVTKTLLALAEVKPPGTPDRLPHLVGQRYDALARAIGVEGVFAKLGETAASPLATFRTHDALRTHLAHGVFTVTLDHQGRWHLAICVLDFRSGRGTRDLFVTRQDEARNILATLEQDSRRLRSALGQLRHDLRAS